MEKMKWVIENDGQTFRATAKVGGGIITVFGNDKPELLSFIGMIGMEAPTAEIKDLTGEVPLCVECENYHKDNGHVCGTGGKRIVISLGNEAEVLKRLVKNCKYAKPTPEKPTSGDGFEAVKNASDALKGFSESMSNVPPFIIFNTDPPREVVDAIKTCAERGQGCTVEVHGLDGTVFVYPKAVKLTAEKICEGMAESQAKRPGSELNAINKRLEDMQAEHVTLTAQLKFAISGAEERVNKLNSLIAENGEINKRLEALEKDTAGNNRVLAVYVAACDSLKLKDLERQAEIMKLQKAVKRIRKEKK